jgi:hypothetical protein
MTQAVALRQIPTLANIAIRKTSEAPPSPATPHASVAAQTVRLTANAILATFKARIYPSPEAGIG